MKKSESEDIAEFYAMIGEQVHSVPGHLARAKWLERLNFMGEELDELEDAFARQDLPDIADALVDLVYVIKGTALMLGLPWGRLWEEVHAANMRKVAGVKDGRMRKDAVKPPGWKGPDHMQWLKEYGYDEDTAKYIGNHRDDE